MKIAIPLYDRFTALDAVGPYEVVQRLPGAEIVWLPPSRARSARTPGSYTCTPKRPSRTCPTPTS
jgi:hypothetical protein